MPEGACILYPGRTHCIHCEKCAEFRASVRAYGRGLVELMHRDAVKQSIANIDAGQEYVKRIYHSSSPEKQKGRTMKQLTTVWGGYDLRALVLRGIRVCRRDGSRVWPGDREVSGLEGSHQKTLGKME